MYEDVSSTEALKNAPPGEPLKISSEPDNFEELKIRIKFVCQNIIVKV